MSLAAAATLACQVAFAQVDPLQQKVDVTLKDADLLIALNTLTIQTGIQFVIEPGDKEYQRVTLSLKDKTAEQAIQYICNSAGAHAVRDENGVFVIKFGTAEKAVESVSAPLVKAKKPVKWAAIKLMHSDAKDLYDMITKGQYNSPDNIFDEYKRTMDNQQMGFSNKNSIMDLSNPNAHYAVPVNGQVGSNSPEYNNSGNGISLPGESSNQRGGAGGQPNGGGGGGGGGGQPGGQPGGGGGDSGGIAITPGEGLLEGIEGLDRVYYDPTRNEFVVQGTQSAIDELRGIIEMFDRAPEQVLVDVQFVTSSNSLDKSLGIDWLYQRGTIFAGNRPGTFARTNDPIFLNYATGNLQTRLRTLLTEGYGKSVSNPSVRTLNNQRATFVAAVQTTIFINQVVGTNGGIIITPQPQSLTSTSILNVRPRINGDRTITMGLAPQISEFGQLRRGPDGSEIPDVLTQSISVVVRLKDGETIAIGGLTRKSDNFSRSKIPVLGDLPIIGQLFQGRNSQQSTQELTIFVTAKIIDEDFLGIGP